MTPAANSTERERAKRRLVVAGIVVLLIGLICVLAGIGLLPPATPLAGVGSVVFLVFSAGLMAGAYAVAGLGVGRVVSGAADRLGGWETPLVVQWTVGLGVMVWVSHGLGVFGLLSGARGEWVAWGVVGLGIVMVLGEVMGVGGAVVGGRGLAGGLRPERWKSPSAWWVLAVPGIAVMVVAASNPPGGIWRGPESEAGAYDVQSYHLALPKEWAVGEEAGGVGRLWPVEHNVYSFLPGYMEAAYLHIGAMSGAGRASGGNFVAGTGVGVIACQYFHAIVGIVGMVGLAGVVRGLIERYTGRTGGEATACGVIAGAAMTNVPWVGVVGSLAYNEMAMVAMTIAGVAVGCPRQPERLGQVESRWALLIRGVGVGFLIGIACGAKPTALFLCAPLGGLALVFGTSGGVWRCIGACVWAVCGGMVAIAPWLVRNYAACGNPVFPFLHEIFGEAHWSAEQFARYGHAHTFAGSIGERLAMLVSDARGALNPQWSILFPIGIVGLVGACIANKTRRVAVVVFVGLLIQVMAWMWLTHLQSRFLIPAVMTACAGIGLGCAAMLIWIRAQAGATRRAERGEGAGIHRWMVAGLMVASLIPVSLGAWCVRNFVMQSGGKPNLLLVSGVEAITGRSFAGELSRLSAAMREKALHDNAGSVIATQFRLKPDDGLYLIGTATPLYYLPGGGNGVANVWYNTTWDGSPLGRAMRAAVDDPAAWTGAVRGAMRDRMRHAGLTTRDVYVLLDESEINRLRGTTSGKVDWFDEVLTTQAIERWLKLEGELVQGWPEPGGVGMFLFRLKGTSP